MSHPAIQLGTWLRHRRQAQHIVIRVFAGQIGLSPAEYAEVEHGVVRWLGTTHEKSITNVLALTGAASAEFHRLAAEARKAEPLEFGDVFERQQLEPVRLRSPKKKQLTAESKTEILDAVFSPLQ